FKQSRHFRQAARRRTGKRRPTAPGRVSPPDFLARAWGRGNVSVSRRGTVSTGETPAGGTAREKRAMKKLLTMSVLAVGLVLASGQQASAWSNIKFGVGLNLH